VEPEVRVQGNFLSMAQQPVLGQGLLIIVASRHTIFGRTPLEEASARRRVLYLTTHTILNRRYSCPRRNSNPQSQQTSGRRAKPYNARPPGSAICIL